MPGACAEHGSRRVTSSRRLSADGSVRPVARAPLKIPAQRACSSLKARPRLVADQFGHSSPAITLRVCAHLFRAAAQANDARDELEAAYGGMLRAGSGAESA